MCACAFVGRFACADGHAAYNSTRSQLHIRHSINVIADVHRFEESIAGRLYHIEVKAVSKDRWSACIMRVPGMPTALMPFYGPTPDEAARQLSAWLTRVYARAANPANTV